MNFEDFSGESKVWIYQSDRKLKEAEIDFCKNEIESFTRRWTSHNNQLKATGDILHNIFLVLMVDETKSIASGCSIDSSVKFVKYLENELGVSFFERMNFVYEERDGEPVIISSREFSKAYQSGLINDSTTVYDNLVQTKSDFLSSWKKTLKSSWHYRFV